MAHNAVRDIVRSPAHDKHGGELPRGKVIVAGCTHGGLSLIRSLGKRGLHVIAMTYNPAEHALASKYINEKAICPHPRDEQAFVDFLLQKAPDWSGALILETNDYYASALARHKTALADHYRLLVPDWEVSQIFIEKDRTYALAKACGVLHPGIFEPSTMAELEAIIDQVAFPAMVKPVRSHEFVARFGVKLFPVQTADELRTAFRRTIDAGVAVIIAEVIPGTDYKTLERVTIYINTRGDIAAEMYNLKLRQTPPMFGMNRVGVTVPLMPEVREEALKLLRASGFRGHASIEFKRDPRDHKLKLIEVNIRLPADTQLAIAAGIDIPWMVYQDIVEDNQITEMSYRPNTYYIHLLTDLIDALTKDRDRRHHIARYFEPYLARRKTFAYLSFSDPQPFLHEVWGRLGRFAVKARKGRSSADS
jgi:predicted ATP-grasp superfamily ATP-dependent carboligase